MKKKLLYTKIDFRDIDNSLRIWKWLQDEEGVLVYDEDDYIKVRRIWL